MTNILRGPRARIRFRNRLAALVKRNRADPVIGWKWLRSRSDHIDTANVQIPRTSGSIKGCSETQIEVDPEMELSVSKTESQLRWLSPLLHSVTPSTLGCSNSEIVEWILKVKGLSGI